MLRTALPLFILFLLLTACAPAVAEVPTTTAELAVEPPEPSATPTLEPTAKPTVTETPTDIPPPATPTSTPTPMGGAHLLIDARAQDELQLLAFDVSSSAYTLLATHERNLSSSSLSPDGQLILYSSREDAEDDYDLYVLNLKDGSELQLTETSEEEIGFRASWSPAGDYILYYSSPRIEIEGYEEYWMQADRGELYLIRPDGTDRRLLASDVWYQDFKWSPDGSRIGFMAGDEGKLGLYVLGIDESEPRKLADAVSIETLDWLHDGEHIVAQLLDYPDQSYYAFHINGEERTRLLEASPQSGISCCIWSPDRTYFLYTDGPSVQSSEVPYAVYRVNSDGTEPRLLFEEDAAHLKLLWSPNEEYILVEAQNEDFDTERLTVYNQVGSEVATIPVISSSLGSITWSPDEQYLAYNSYSYRGSETLSDVYVFDILDSDFQQRIDVAHFDGVIAWDD